MTLRTVSLNGPTTYVKEFLGPVLFLWCQD